MDVHGLRPGQSLGLFGGYCRQIIPVKPSCRLLQRKKGVVNLAAVENRVRETFGITYGKFEDF